MKKWSYWLSIIIGGIAGVIIGKAWEIFNRPDRAISYQQEMFVKDTTILAANGQTKPAYILQGALWNSGKTTIDSTEVREPLLITVAGADEILHYELKREVHPQTSRFRLAPATKTSFSVNWQYFDPGDGFSFSILYIGDKKAEVKPKGRVLYVEGFTEVNPDLQKTVGFNIVAIIIGLFIFGFVSFQYFKKEYEGFWGLLGLLFVATVSLAWSVRFIAFMIEEIRNPAFESYLVG